MTQSIIAIDPGYAKRGQGCACARFDRGLLTGVWYTRPRELITATRGRTFLAASIDVVIVEEMQVRPRGDGYIDPRVLLRLQADGFLLAGLYAGACGSRVEALTPAQWKGSVPKPVQHASLWRRLSAAETAVLGGDETWARISAAVERGARERWAHAGVYYYGSWQGHNVLDAVGLGVSYLKGRS